MSSNLRDAGGPLLRCKRALWVLFQKHSLSAADSSKNAQEGRNNNNKNKGGDHQQPALLPSRYLDHGGYNVVFCRFLQTDQYATHKGAAPAERLSEAEQETLCRVCASLDLRTRYFPAVPVYELVEAVVALFSVREDLWETMLDVSRALDRASLSKAAHTHEQRQHHHQHKEEKEENGSDNINSSSSAGAVNWAIFYSVFLLFLYDDLELGAAHGAPGSSGSAERESDAAVVLECRRVLGEVWATRRRSLSAPRAASAIRPTNVAASAEAHVMQEKVQVAVAAEAPAGRAVGAGRGPAGATSTHDSTQHDKKQQQTGYGNAEPASAKDLPQPKAATRQPGAGVIVAGGGSRRASGAAPQHHNNNKEHITPSAAEPKGETTNTVRNEPFAAPSANNNHHHDPLSSEHHSPCRHPAREASPSATPSSVSTVAAPTLSNTAVKAGPGSPASALRGRVSVVRYDNSSHDEYNSGDSLTAKEAVPEADDDECPSDGVAAGTATDGVAAGAAGSPFARCDSAEQRRAFRRRLEHTDSNTLGAAAEGVATAETHENCRRPDKMAAEEDDDHSPSPQRPLFADTRQPTPLPLTAGTAGGVYPAVREMVEQQRLARLSGGGGSNKAGAGDSSRHTNRSQKDAQGTETDDMQQRHRHHRHRRHRHRNSGGSGSGETGGSSSRRCRRPRGSTQSQPDEGPVLGSRHRRGEDPQEAATAVAADAAMEGRRTVAAPLLPADSTAESRGTAAATAADVPHADDQEGPHKRSPSPLPTPVPLSTTAVAGDGGAGAEAPTGARTTAATAASAAAVPAQMARTATTASGSIVVTSVSPVQGAVPTAPSVSFSPLREDFVVMAAPDNTHNVWGDENYGQSQQQQQQQQQQRDAIAIEESAITAREVQADMLPQQQQQRRGERGQREQREQRRAPEAATKTAAVAVEPAAAAVAPAAVSDPAAAPSRAVVRIVSVRDWNFDQPSVYLASAAQNRKTVVAAVATTQELPTPPTPSLDTRPQADRVVVTRPGEAPLASPTRAQRLLPPPPRRQPLAAVSSSRANALSGGKSLEPLAPPKRRASPAECRHNRRSLSASAAAVSLATTPRGAETTGAATTPRTPRTPEVPRRCRQAPIAAGRRGSLGDSAHSTSPPPRVSRRAVTQSLSRAATPRAPPVSSL